MEKDTKQKKRNEIQKVEGEKKKIFHEIENVFCVGVCVCVCVPSLLVL